MNTTDLLWGISAILAVLLVILVCCRFRQRRKAKCLVKKHSEITAAQRFYVIIHKS